jgi:hypothetical protein
MDLRAINDRGSLGCKEDSFLPNEGKGMYDKKGKF